MLRAMTTSFDALSSGAASNGDSSVATDNTHGSITTPPTTPRNTSLQKSCTNLSNSSSSCSRRNGNTSSSSSSQHGKYSRHSARPGILSLMEQGDWKAVSQRARKYPKELQVWARMKKSSFHPASVGGGSISGNTISSSNSGSGSTSGCDSFTSRDREPSPCPSSCPSGGSTITFSMNCSMNQEGSSSGLTNGVTSIQSTNLPSQYHNPNKQASAKSFVSMESHGTQATNTTIPTGNISSIKCKALHHACQKLRSIHTMFQRELRELESTVLANQYSSSEEEAFVTHPNENTLPTPTSASLVHNLTVTTLNDVNPVETDDPWIEACKAIITLIEVYPEAAADRESRHGCLPLHLAAFAMRETPTPSKDLLQRMGLLQKEKKDERGAIDEISPRCVMGIDPIRKDLPSPGKDKMFHYKFLNIVDEDVRNLLQQDEQHQQQNDHPSKSTRILSRQERPPAISKSTSRDISNGSTAYEYPAFNLNQYIANQSLRNEYSLRVIQALLEAYPKGARVESEGGRFPLHIALTGQASLPIVQKLLEAYPDATRRRNQQGELPIHIVAKHGASHEDIAPILLRAHPFGVEGKNRWDRTPFQEALAMAGENGRMWQIELIAALRRHPTQWMADLRKGLFWRFPRLEEEMEGLDDDSDDRDSSADCTSQGELFDLDAIQFRSAEDETPTPLRRKRRNLERMDLFHLIQAKQWDLMASKLDHEPTEAKKRQKKRNRAGYITDTPALHFACQFHPSYEAVDALLTAYPKAVYKPIPPYGQLPIHYVSTWGAPTDTIDLLIAECPSVVREKDYLGNLPLHCACFAGLSIEIIEILLFAFPGGVVEPNSEGSTPIDLVRRLNHPHQKRVLEMMEQVSLDWLEKDRQDEEDKELVMIQHQRHNHQKQSAKTLLSETKDKVDGEKVKKGWNISRGRKRFGRKKKMEQVVTECEPPKVNISGSSLDGGGIETELAENGDATVLWV